ncbi:YqhV family protein [Evansella tamaricis]|uniref:YqhV family protein n=1 Tax=Evansella tamaricis TaxID=2069301 RepID=A0ABS6JBG3_9BACI|nr:YqhV family protein [Evansella tamaricis]MBU9710182.1 YqhV family protein [Evansella tamaricis]
MKEWLSTIEMTLIGMIILRLLSGSFEITAALLMLKFNSIEKALAINAILAIVGPLVLILTMTIGLVGIADKMPFSKLLMVGLGVLLILIGLRR